MKLPAKTSIKLLYIVKIYHFLLYKNSHSMSTIILHELLRPKIVPDTLATKFLSR